MLDPAPWYAAPYVRFRMARKAESECSASECSLVCNDYWNAGYGRIVMVPRVKLAYDNKVFEIMHPDRRNLTAIRGYTRLGGLADDPRTDPQDRSCWRTVRTTGVGRRVGHGRHLVFAKTFSRRADTSHL